MRTLQKGRFFGVSKNIFQIDGLTIVDSRFHRYHQCPWHYHQHAHFAFTTGGSLTETHKRKKLILSAGSLMYNHSQEPHCNADYSEDVSALHVDISPAWFSRHDFQPFHIEGVRELNDPVLKNIFFNLFAELKNFEAMAPIAIESLVVKAVSLLMKMESKKAATLPVWVERVKSILYERSDGELSLSRIATEVNVHPVYLSQQFPIYTNCNFGEYLRKTRIEKAVTVMLREKSRRLTDLAQTCGFADQSHFIRIFKKYIGITPLAFKRLIKGR